MANGSILLVTGTDTGVGKTWVACGLARALRAAGRAVAVRKPVETGCGPAPMTAVPGASPRSPVVSAVIGPGLWPTDAAALREAAGAEEPLDAVCAVRFAEPLAPAIAAERVGVAIDVAALVPAYLARAREVDVLVAEGAGGLLVPLRSAYSFADLARELGACVLVVVGARLGAINHALLTLEVARARGLALVGLVVNHFSPACDLATDSLTETLRGLTDVPLLAEVPFGGDPAPLLRGLASGWAPDSPLG